MIFLEIQGLPPKIIQRFWAKVNKNCSNGCWEWSGCRTNGGNGYGMAFNGEKVIPAHRLVYQITKGEIPPGVIIDHICHNSGCVNPDHLRTASKSENGRNRLLNANNKSGFKGVSWNKQNKKYEAVISVNRKQKRLGFFDTPELAHKAYCDASALIFGKFAHNGVIKSLEKDVQAAIIQAFWFKYRIELVPTDAGGKGFRGKGGKTHGHSGIPSGFPDLVGVIPPMGRAIYIEVKRPGSKVAIQGKQDGWLQKLWDAGAVAFWADSVDMAFRLYEQARIADSVIKIQPLEMP